MMSILIIGKHMHQLRTNLSEPSTVESYKVWKMSSTLLCYVIFALQNKKVWQAISCIKCICLLFKGPFLVPAHPYRNHWSTLLTTYHILNIHLQQYLPSSRLVIQNNNFSHSPRPVWQPCNCWIVEMNTNYWSEQYRMTFSSNSHLVVWGMG